MSDIQVYENTNSAPSAGEKPVTGTVSGTKVGLDVAIVSDTSSSFPKNFSTATNTRPTVTTTSSIVLAANANRLGAQVFNQSGAIIYIKLGATAVVNQGYRVANNEPYPVPPGFTGAIHAIRGAGSGAIEVMEGTV